MIKLSNKMSRFETVVVRVQKPTIDSRVEWKIILPLAGCDLVAANVKPEDHIICHLML